MSTPTLIFLIAVMFVGLPAALKVSGKPSIRIRNATAFAIVAMWLFGRLVYALTGEWLPLQAMVIQDMVVVATIFAKQDWRDLWPYRTMKAQLAAMWLERSPWDRAVLALFAPTWLFYAPVLSPILQFWTLWSIGLTQMMLAGWEAFHLWQRADGQRFRADARGPSPPLTFAPVRSGSYG